MTPNEARKVLETYRKQSRRRDVLGKVARQEMKEAYCTLARHSLEISSRYRRNKRQAYIAMAGFYRQAAADLVEMGI